MKYRKKPIIVEAVQYNKYGDHPEVEHFKCIEANSGESCPRCGEHLGCHGWIDTLEGGHIVCDGDWIITGINGETYPCKPDIFEKTYELVEGE